MRARPLRNLVLHIGTHKTGTTTLQTVLGRATETLAAHGVLVPRTGRGVDRYVGSHEGIAASLLPGNTGPSQPGGFAELLIELERSPQSTAIVSSENLSRLFRFPNDIRRIADGLAAIGFRATILLYVREQSAFAESGYAELVKHGYTASPVAFARALIESGPRPENNAWEYCFNYVALAEAFATVLGRDRLLVRAFPAGRVAGTLVNDFFSTLGLAHVLVDVDEMQRAVKTNTRSGFLDVLGDLYRNASAHVFDAPEPRALIAELGIDETLLPSAFELLDADDVARVRAAYAASNRELARSFGAHPIFEIERGSSPQASLAKRVLVAVAERYRLSVAI